MSESEDIYLTGQLIIAMPGMPDPRFERSVIYMCAHNDEGAMGIVVNRLMDDMSFAQLLTQVGIEPTGMERPIRVHVGGPVETGRGFVLHSADYVRDASVEVDGSVALTASLDILKAMAEGDGPKQAILALGYSGWGPGQLEEEIQNNGWLHAPADSEIVFDDDVEHKWERAIAKLGFDPYKLSSDSGHA